MMLDDDECGEIGGMISRGNRRTWRKPDPLPLCSLQILHDLTRADAGGSRQLTA
jgi:hypothetical protein